MGAHARVTMASPTSPSSPSDGELRAIDDVITRALRRHREALARVARLEFARPAGSGWGATTQHQSRLALARRQSAEAQAELRAARIRALTVRLERLRATPTPSPAPAPTPEQQLLVRI
ncbi:MAG: hypothetical protein L0Y66_04755 [Myxococcaceae bacterium]|nr:hypothetical protein [Myxococcaceae bacterium]MCI0672905.1 hypothetical protein [Myxococcaceae bacterium]